MKTKQSVSLYIHIPFCIKKCKYCDFLSFSSTEEGRNSYIRLLAEELKQKSIWTKDQMVISIFFGGGTPSILTKDQITYLMDVIYQYYTVEENAEITIEANPGTMTREKLKAYKEAGINRLSIGLQSTEDEELKRIGRIHTYEQFEENYHMARKVGFSNINIDLMSALPGQTMDSYERTLKKVLALEPEHISAYSLIVEDGTPLAGDDLLLEMLPGEEIDRKMYHRTKELLQKAGYERYEISNYAKKGYACRHNMVYWQGGNYLGFGLGASSYFEGERFHNPMEMEEYHTYQKEEAEVLSREDKMEEFMFLGLRMTEGIQKEEFQSRFGVSMESIYGKILEEQEKEGLILQNEKSVKLTERGLDVSNYVFCDYLLEKC